MAFFLIWAHVSSVILSRRLKRRTALFLGISSVHRDNWRLSTSLLKQGLDLFALRLYGALGCLTLRVFGLCAAGSVLRLSTMSLGGTLLLSCAILGGGVCSLVVLELLYIGLRQVLVKAGSACDDKPLAQDVDLLLELNDKSLHLV